MSLKDRDSLNQRERKRYQTLYDVTYMQNLNKTPNSQTQKTDWWLPETGGTWGGGVCVCVRARARACGHVCVCVCEMGKGGQRVHISSSEVNKSLGCNIQHGDYS